MKKFYTARYEQIFMYSVVKPNILKDLYNVRFEQRRFRRISRKE
mgnify:FL=1